nr:hypothetical protein [Amylolactobacillus amylophilus]
MTDAAAQMLIRQIMSEHQSELLLYDKVKLNQAPSAKFTNQFPN